MYGFVSSHRLKIGIIVRSSKFFCLIVFTTIFFVVTINFLNAQKISSSLSFSSSEKEAKQYFSGEFNVNIKRDKDKSLSFSKKLKFEILGPKKIYKNKPVRFQILLLPEDYDNANLAEEVYSHYGLFNSLEYRYPHIRITDTYITPWTSYPSIVMVGEKNAFKIDKNSIKWLAYLPYSFFRSKNHWKNLTPSGFEYNSGKVLEEITKKKPLERTSLLKSLRGKMGESIHSSPDPQKALETENDILILNLIGPLNLWDRRSESILGILGKSSATARGTEFLVTFTKAGECNIEFGSSEKEYSKTVKKGIGEARGGANLTLLVESEEVLSLSERIPIESFPQLSLLGVFGAVNIPIEKQFKNKFNPLGINLEFSKSNWNVGLGVGSNYMEANKDDYVLKTLAFYFYGKYSLLKFFNNNLDFFVSAGGLYWRSSFQYTKYPSLEDYYPVEKDNGFSYLLSVGTGHTFGNFLIRLQYQLLRSKDASFGKIPSETEFTNYYTLYTGSQQLQILLGYRFNF